MKNWNSEYEKIFILSQINIILHGCILTLNVTMRNLFIVSVLIFCTLISCKQNLKSEARTIYNNEFKWRISIPSGFDTVSAAAWAKMQNRGADAIEKTVGSEIENNSTTIFVFKSDQFNYFESNYQPFDTAKDGNYDDRFKEVNNILYETFATQMKGAQLDSTSYTENIDGLTFKVFNTEIVFPNKMVMKVHMYSRLFDKKEFTVNILTVDEQKEKELQAAWLDSKFGR